MKKKNLQRFIVYIFLASILIIPSLIASSQIVNASSSDEKYVPLAPLPCVAGGNVTCPEGEGTIQKEVDFQGYIQYAFNILIALSAVAAVFMIVWGGITYMTTDAYFPKKEGLEKVKNAITGLLLVLCSYIILKTIDPRLVKIPSTLVPQITTYKKALSVDTADILLGQIEKEVNEYGEKRNYIGNSLGEIEKRRVEIQSELDGIESRIAGLNLEFKEDQDKYQSLNVEKKKIQNKQNSIEIEYQTELLKSELNGVLSNTVNTVKEVSTNDGFFNDRIQKYTDAISQLDQNKEIVKKYVEKRKEKLAKLGQNDQSEVENQIIYTNSIIDLEKINVDIVLTNNSKKNIADDPELFEKKIEEIEKNIQKITDSQLKSDFEDKVSTTRTLFVTKRKL